MNALQVISEIQEAGGQLALFAGELKARRLTAATRKLVKRNKAEIIRVLSFLPYLKNGELIIPYNTSRKYKWWAGGQSVSEILLELGASYNVAKNYTDVTPNEWRHKHEMYGEHQQGEAMQKFC